MRLLLVAIALGLPTDPPEQLPPIPPIPPPPCIPLLDPGCEIAPPLPCIPILNPDCEKPPKPPAGDDPPTFAPLRIVERGRLTVLISWSAAVDDHGVYRYLLYRDGRFLGDKPPEVRRHRFRLLCGRHAYRVDAVDSYGQRATSRLKVTRRC